MTGDKMKLARLLALAAMIASPGAYANDFPTTDRVEYVIECMKNHAGKYEYLYKCSCVIDHIAQDLAYDEYVELSTAHRQQRLGGERGAVFRDPDIIKVMSRKFQGVLDSSNKSCLVK
jgi:hypothetical protein